MSARVSTLAAIALLASADAVPAAAGNPSFDCDSARQPVERLICQDDELSALDLELARVFASALAKAPASQVGSIKAQHSSWRKTLMRCSREADARACTLEAYQIRLGEL